VIGAAPAAALALALIVAACETPPTDQATPTATPGFYYHTDGVGYSAQTLHLGTYDATPEQLERLEGQETTVAIVR
jgi:hypothetical protein